MSAVNEKKYSITEDDKRFMEMAAKIAEDNIDRGGGHFGALIVALY